MSLPRILAARGRRRLLVRLVANGMAQAAVAIAAALLTRRAFVAGTTDATASATSLTEVAGALVLAAAVIFALRLLERADSERLGQHYVTRVRGLLFEHLVGGAFRAPGRGRYGTTMTRLVTDLSALRSWVSSGLARLIVGTFSVAGVLVALALLSPIAAVAATTIVVLFATSTVVTREALRARVREMRRRRGRLAANLGEKVLAATTIQQFGRAGRECRRVRRQGLRLAQAAVRRAKDTALLRSLSDVALPLTAAVILGLSSFDWPGGAVGAGRWTATLFLLGMMQGSLRDLARVWNHRLAFEQGRERLEQVVSVPIPRDSFVARALGGDGPLEVSFEDVHVTGALHGVTASLAAGESVSVQGPSGSGKSTVLALAARIADADDGCVRLEGYPINHWTLSSIRRAVMLVSPDVPLLQGTLLENLEYGSGPLAVQARSDLLKLAGLEDTIRSLPDRLYTEIEEGGRGLPEGFCARLRLARALACQPRLLLIDDPVFLSDAEARHALGRVVDLRASTIMISTPNRRLGIRTDKTWRLEDGRLIAAPSSAKVIPLSRR